MLFLLAAGDSFCYIMSAKLFEVKRTRSAVSIPCNLSDTESPCWWLRLVRVHELWEGRLLGVSGAVRVCWNGRGILLTGFATVLKHNRCQELALVDCTPGQKCPWSRGAAKFCVAKFCMASEPVSSFRRTMFGVSESHKYLTDERS